MEPYHLLIVINFFLNTFTQIAFVDCGKDIPSSILVASPPLLLVALTSIRGPKAILSSLVSTNTSSNFLLHPMTIRSCCLIPFMLVIHQSMILNSADTNNQPLEFRVAPICFVAFATIIMMNNYYTNRAHKHGCLLTCEMKSQSIFVGIAMLLSCSIAMDRYSATTVVENVTVFLLGSLITVLFGFTFACVADVWYAVGSGQFLMISLDTAGMMLFFICPIIVLMLRFLDKYGENIASWGGIVRDYYVQSVPRVLISNIGVGNDDDMLPISLVILLVMVSSVIGVPLLNAMCPMGGYLFSRAYTHGQPNTKRVALCVNFSDLSKDDKLWDELLGKNEVGSSSRGQGRDNSKLAAVLNIYVTLEELTLCRNELQTIAKRGHFIALSPTEFDEPYSGPSILYGNRSTCNLQIAHYEYTELFGEEPKWLLSRSAGSCGRHPAILCEARNLGMKVVYWSTLIHMSTGGRGLSIDQQSAIRDSCSDKNGGSIIYLSCEKGRPASSSSNVNQITPNYLLREVLDSIGDDYSLQSLSDVARDDADMILQ